MRNKNKLYDFRAFGKAIKEARIKKGLTREQTAGLIHIDPRYLTNIENKGQTPSVRVLYTIVTLFNLSVDQFFYPDTEPSKSTRRRQLDNDLNDFDEHDLLVMQATANGLKQAKEEKKS